MNAAQFTVIKGNASEIGYLAGADGATSRGVDSSGKLSDPAAVVKQLALRERTSALDLSNASKTSEQAASWR
jgi:hydroxyethylthiazole kinase-like sugar kinase family protein